MGNPRDYYRIALQEMCYYLIFDNELKLAKQWREELDIDKMEKFVLEKKEILSDKEFYYAAGLASRSMIAISHEHGTDGVNAAIGGFAEFEDFIGIREDDEDED